MLDRVYRHTEGEAVFQEARAPAGDELEGLLDKIIARLMKMLTRLGYLVEEQGMTYLADIGVRTCKPPRGLAGRAGPESPAPSPGTNGPPDCLCPGSWHRIAIGPQCGCTRTPRVYFGGA